MSNVDGIKKLSGEELKRSRKIVLDYIGEEDKINEPKKNTVNTKNTLKTMDGIMVSKKKISPKKEVKKKFLNKDFLDDLSTKGEDIEKENKEITENISKRKNVKPIISFPKPVEEKKGYEIKKQKIESFGELRIREEKNIARKEAEETLRKAKEEEQQKEIFRQEKEILEIEKRKEEIRKKKEEKIALKNKLKEDARKKKEEKIFQQTQDKRQKKELKDKNKATLQTAKLRKAKKRKVKRKEFKDKIIKKCKDGIGCFKNSFKKCKDGIGCFKNSFKKLTFKKISNFLLYLVVFIISFILLAYIIFSLVLLRINFDCEFIRKIAAYVPVPAIISTEGVITYKEYNEIYKDKSVSIISERFILEKLIKKYNLKFDDDELILAKEILEERLVKDQEINRVSFMRIDDIRKAISGGMKFSDAQERYGDDQGTLDKDNFKDFEDDINDLNIGDISDTISTEKGNYIVRKNNDNFEYLRVDSINLDKYLTNEANKLKLWFLIK